VHEELQRELAEAATTLETATPKQIISWTYDRFGADLAYACSFEDVALLHMVIEVVPDVTVIFLDTEAHFPETYDFVTSLTEQWRLNVLRTTPGPDAADTPCGADGCCAVRKVAPLQRAVAGKAAWFTSVKRVDAATRAGMPVVSWDDKFDLVKVNPLATWTDEDVAYYLQSHQLPEHPLWAQGYASIGCAPVTVRPLPGADRRSGRWAGSDKVECGLHE
jgi:phosphoadenosine phosphosulfate reductase